MNFNAPLVLIGACYMTFLYIGYYAFIVVVLTLLQLFIGYLFEKPKRPSWKKIGDNVRYRHVFFTEILNNIKGVKLYGWEHKII